MLEQSRAFKGVQSSVQHVERHVEDAKRSQESGFTRLEALILAMGERNNGPPPGDGATPGGRPGPKLDDADVVTPQKAENFYAAFNINPDTAVVKRVAFEGGKISFEDWWTIIYTVRRKPAWRKVLETLQCPDAANIDTKQGIWSALEEMLTDEWELKPDVDVIKEAGPGF
eukprot:11279457-Karenia_brevis.AAC.1